MGWPRSPNPFEHTTLYNQEWRVRTPWHTCGAAGVHKPVIVSAWPTGQTFPHPDPCPQRGSSQRSGRDLFFHGGVVDQRLRASVGENMLQFGPPVAVVHVDRHRPQLERREYRLDVLGAVVQRDTDPGLRPDARTGQIASEPGCAVIQLPPGPCALAVDYRDPVLPHVRDRLQHRPEALPHARNVSKPPPLTPDPPGLDPSLPMVASVDFR